MEIGFNTKLNNLKNGIINTIGESKLPVGAVYYLLKDILAELNDTYRQTLAIEQQVQAINNEEDDKEEKDNEN